MIIGFAVKSMMHGEETESGKMMMVSSGASSSDDPNQGWTEALRSSKGQGETEERESTGTSSSINLQKERARPAPAPYDLIFLIWKGDDSVESIQLRLLSGFPSPSAHDIDMARIQAQDLFEVKVEIIRAMAVLHPRGDWLRRGARAMDNPRTATGGESLSHLHALLHDLNQNGIRSSAFVKLQERVLLKRDDLDANSEA